MTSATIDDFPEMPTEEEIVKARVEFQLTGKTTVYIGLTPNTTPRRYPWQVTLERVPDHDHVVQANYLDLLTGGTARLQHDDTDGGNTWWERRVHLVIGR